MKPKKPKTPVAASTQDFTEIEAVCDDILLLRSRGACVIIAVAATNFVLLSREEQTTMIFAYASLLNSLSFPVQVISLAKKMDISSYLGYLDGKIRNDIDNRTALTEYKDFVQSIVKKSAVLEKKFYFAIPFSPLEMGPTALKQSLSRDYIITRAKTSLYPKRDHLLRLLRRSGLTPRALTGDDIVNLFYNLYNSAIGQPAGPS